MHLQAQVIIAFTASSMLTFFAMCVGWFTDSIEDSNCNGVDYLVVDHLRAMLRRSKITRGKVPQQYLEQKASGIKGLNAFVLAQSDQQLVTGIAILIAGFMKSCSTDMHHFEIVAALAWFSAVTHVASLQLSKNYLIKHTTVRNIRVVVLLMFLVLLLIAQTLGYAPVNPTSPAVCSWSQLANIEPEAGILIFEMILFWVVANGSAIANLYMITSEVAAYRIKQAYNRVTRMLRIGTEKESQDAKPRETNGPFSKKSQRNKPMPLWETVFGGTRSIPWLRNVAHNIIILLNAMQKLQQSFLDDIIGLYLINLVGVLGIVIARWRTSVDVNGDENEMGFGQIVPLVLLGLPILAIVEVHSGILLWTPSEYSIIS